jgi:hypothetical protein
MMGLIETWRINVVHHKRIRIMGLIVAISINDTRDKGFDGKTKH